VICCQISWEYNSTTKVVAVVVSKVLYVCSPKVSDNCDVKLVDKKEEFLTES